MAESETPPGSGEAPEMRGKILPVTIEDEVKTDFLNYAVSTIVARALPDVRDGLKPVHRRILYSMDELGLHPGAETKKSARIVGDAMGKYHPHGDAALYEAMVRLAQNFSLRYPVIQGQGNFGSIDGDPPAAMRYTEAKLSKVGNEMLGDLRKGTVDFVPNFDESLNEPLVLPAAVPFLLVNGSEGIAVGMATNMPAHNLREVCGAVIALIDNPDISLEELMSYIRGPDFPTGGVIFGRRGIKEAYTTGRGKISIRGKFHIETSKSGKETIVFTELPYGVKPKVLLEKISELVRDKNIDGISYVNDESDRDGIRVIVELRKDAILKVVLNRLFAQTALQSTFGIINIALVKGRPQQLTLKELVYYFVEHRIEVITRRTQFELRKAEERENILNGFIITLTNIDEIVALIKASRDVETAKNGLKEKFLYPAARERAKNEQRSEEAITARVEAQAQAIIDMRLGRLTHLEVEKIEKELNELKIQIDYYKSLLADDKKLRGVIKDELNTIAEKYGDDRRTEIVDGEIESIDIEDLIKKEEMMIIISNIGYIKRVPVSAWKNQGRGGKGLIGAKLSEEDFVKQIFVASTHEYITFITSAGKAYWMKVHELPEGTRTSKGAHIKGLLTVSPNEEITAVVSFKEVVPNRYLFMGTARGVVKKVQITEFANAKTRGVIAIKLDEGDRLVSALLTGGDDEIVLISRHGRALRTHESAVRAMGRGSHGVCGIKLDTSDELSGVLRVVENEAMLLLSEYGYGKRVDFSEFNLHGRATAGQRIYALSDKTGELVSCVNIRDDEELMCITSQGQSIRVRVETIRVMGRSASGVRIVNIEKPDFVVGADRIVREDEELKKREREAENQQNEAHEAPQDAQERDESPDENPKDDAPEEGLKESGDEGQLDFS